MFICVYTSTVYFFFSHTFAKTFFVTFLCIQAKDEALPGVLGNRGERAFISREHGNKGKLLRGTGEQRNKDNMGEHKHIFDLGEQGNEPIYFSGTREQVPLGGTQRY